MKPIFTFLKKRWYVIVIILIGVGGYLYQQQQVKAEKEKQNIYIIKRMDLREELSLSGKVEADEHVTLRFQSSGKLTWVGVKPGDTVKKFQGIASLDTRDLKMRLQKNLNSYASQRGSFDQSKDDNQRVGDQPIRENGDRMKRLLEDAQYDLSSSVLDVELGNLALEYSYLYTPIAGIVVRADVTNPGTNITPAGAEYEVINPDTIYFSFTADQTEVIKLQEGMNAELTFDAYPEDSMKGELYYASYVPKSGETGTVYEGRLRIQDTDVIKYRFGMTGDVTFVLSEKSRVLSVPVNYIKSDTKGKYVEQIKQGKLQKTYIIVGSDIDGTYEIRKGLSEGDSILITNAN